MLRFPVRDHPASTVHLTALIDIVFLLLIYFLLTSNFVMQQGIGVKLPEVSGDHSAADQRIVITVDRAGKFYVNEKPLAAKALSFYLQSVLSPAGDDSVVVRADGKVMYDRVVLAMDIAKKAGAANLLLATERRSVKIK